MHPSIGSPSTSEDNRLAVHLLQLRTQQTRDSSDARIFGKTLKGPAVIGDIEPDPNQVRRWV
jgi:hypothetical protein